MGELGLSYKNVLSLDIGVMTPLKLEMPPTRWGT